MRNPGGCAIIIDTFGGVVEQDSFTCSHCNAVKFVKPKERPEDLGGFCTVCAGLICSECVGKGCDPMEKKLERMEERDRIRRSYG